MPGLIATVAGTTLATVFSAGLLALPAVAGVRRLLGRRVQAPFARDRLERNLVLASAMAGAAGAVVWADLAELLFGGGALLADLLLGFVAAVPLGAVPWIAGELFSGASLRRWKGLAAAVAASCATSWITYALVWSPGVRRPLPLSPEIPVIQLAACAVAGLGAAWSYLAVRGEPLESLPGEAVWLERL